MCDRRIGAQHSENTADIRVGGRRKVEPALNGCLRPGKRGSAAGQGRAVPDGLLLKLLLKLLAGADLFPLGQIQTARNLLTL